MRTTLDLPDETFRQLKSQAALSGLKLKELVTQLIQRGLTANDIVIDTQTRERIPDVFDTFKPDQVVSSDPIEGAWVVPGGKVVLGVRGP